MTEQEKQKLETRKYYADRFDVPLETVVWGQAGICYGTVVLNDKDAAEKVSKQVKASGATANGGFMHGMALGHITETNDGKFHVTH